MIRINSIVATYKINILYFVCCVPVHSYQWHACALQCNVKQKHSKCLCGI